MVESTVEPIKYVARRLGVPWKWLLAEAIAGRVPAIDCGGKILANPAAVEAELAARAASARCGKEAANAS